MFNIRKVCTAAIVASLLASSAVATTTPASAGWLVRGLPLHVGTIHYHRVYGYHRFYARHVYGLYGRNFRSGFFSSCAGTYGVPIC